MNDRMQAGTAEAMRLTNEGRLAEATAVIQRTLGGAFAPATHTDGPGGAEGPVEESSRVADEASDTKTSSQPTTKKRALRPAPRPVRRFRGAPHRPDSVSGTMPGMTAAFPEAVPVSARGQFVERSYSNRAGTRAYKLYIPSGYTGQAVPLLVMLHGCTQNPDDFATGTRMNVLAEAHTFLVAYPTQSANANTSRCWNWFKPADQQRGHGEPSLIAGITREIVGEYVVASDCVYLAGMSAGGTMAAIMGATYPDLYAAIGVHSGLAPGAAHDPPSASAAMRHGGPATTPRDTITGESERVVLAILFHGDRDTTVHPHNGDNLLAHYRGSMDGLGPRMSKDQGRVPGGHAYTRATYLDADGRPFMEQWTIHGLGHAWSGGNPQDRTPIPRAPTPQRRWCGSSSRFPSDSR